MARIGVDTPATIIQPAITHKAAAMPSAIMIRMRALE